MYTTDLTLSEPHLSFCWFHTFLSYKLKMTINESNTGSAPDDAAFAAIAEENQDEEEVKSPDAAINQHAALQYWQSVDASNDGMLGGIPSLAGFSNFSNIDLKGSRSFLAKLGIGTKSGRHSVASILEGGAGYG